MLDPSGPQSGEAMAVDRLLKLGAKREDLSIIARWAGYEAVFSTLFALDDATPDGGVTGLYSDLLAADPTGRAGRPEVSGE